MNQSTPNNPPDLRAAVLASGPLISKAYIFPWLVAVGAAPAVFIMSGLSAEHATPLVLLALTLTAAVASTYLAGRRRELRLRGNRLSWSGVPFSQRAGSMQLEEMATLELRPAWKSPFEKHEGRFIALVVHTKARTEIVYASEDEATALRAAQAVVRHLGAARDGGAALQPDLIAWLNTLQASGPTTDDLVPRGTRPYLSLAPRRPLVPSDRYPAWLNGYFLALISGGLGISAVLSAIGEPGSAAFYSAFIPLLVAFSGAIAIITMPRRRFARRVEAIDPSAIGSLEHTPDGSEVSLIAEVNADNPTMLSVVGGRPCVLSTISGFGSDRAVMAPADRDGGRIASFRLPRCSLSVSCGAARAHVSLADAAIALPSTAIVERDDSRYDQLKHGDLRFLLHRAQEIKPEPSIWAGVGQDDEGAAVSPRNPPADPILESELRVGDRIVVRGIVRREAAGPDSADPQGVFRANDQVARGVWIDATVVTAA